MKPDPVDILRSHLSNYNEVEMRSSPFTQHTRSQGLYGRRGNTSLYCPNFTEELSSPSSQTFQKIFLSSFLALYFVYRRGKESSTGDTQYQEYSAGTYRFKPLQQLLSDAHIPGELSSLYETVVDGPEIITAALFLEELRSIVHL